MKLMDALEIEAKGLSEDMAGSYLLRLECGLDLDIGQLVAALEGGTCGERVSRLLRVGSSAQSYRGGCAGSG